MVTLTPFEWLSLSRLPWFRVNAIFDWSKYKRTHYNVFCWNWKKRSVIYKIEKRKRLEKMLTKWGRKTKKGQKSRNLECSETLLHLSLFLFPLPVSPSFSLPLCRQCMELKSMLKHTMIVREKKRWCVILNECVRVCERVCLRVREKITSKKTNSSICCCFKL